jgi:HD-GYP domain-containing protein (c-di-GMP phosphodiesterase class II)
MTDTRTTRVAADRARRADRRALTFTREAHLDHAGELVGVVQRLSLARSLPEIQRIVGTAARQLINADGAAFVLREGNQCFYADENSIAPLWKGLRFPMQSCISGWVMLHGEPAVIPNIYADDRVPHDAYKPTFVKSLAMVAIRRLDPLGAIGAYWACRHTPTAEQVEVLQALADSSAVAIANVMAYRELDDSRLETLKRLALAGEYRDDGTHQHTDRVARTSFLIARKLGLPESEAVLIRQAAPLHDLGKLSLPDSILMKRTRLTVAEYEEVKRHPATGAAILAGSTSSVLRLAEEIALTHHEWWDGSGYPAGLKGREIPLSGRIVALADVFDALTHTRPYKLAWSGDDAVTEICRLTGRQFDPVVVQAFLALDAESLVELPAAVVH